MNEAPQQNGGTGSAGAGEVENRGNGHMDRLEGDDHRGAMPARAGEILTLYASGLGPTRPGVEPGKPFTADPPQVVNSPVQVIVNGNPADVMYAGGYPGAVDAYQVNFRVPPTTALGQAALQLASAWIAGPSVNIPVQ